MLPLGGAPTNVQCELNPDFPDGRHFILRWIDNSTFETEFVIEFSSNGGALWMTLDVIASGGAEASGVLVVYFAPQTFLPGTSYTFRVKGRDLGTGLETAWSAPSTGCTTAASSQDLDGCLSGQLYFQGRTDHGGWPILLDGLPVTETKRDGTFGVCGLPAGTHDVSAGGDGYLDAVAAGLGLDGEGTVKLPFLRMVGGDATGDGTIGLPDLVLTGAALGGGGPAAAAVDFTGDGVVNLFDLVLVAANYGAAGPVDWTEQTPGEPGATPLLLHELPPRTFGPPDGVPVFLAERALEDGQVAVDVRASDLAQLFGAEVGLAYDPDRVAVVDVSVRPGVQILPGPDWGDAGTAFVAVNAASAATREIRLAVSRTAPAAPLSGDAVLATVVLQPLVEAWQGSAALTFVELRRPDSTVIDTRWTGLDVSGRWAIHVPFVARGFSR